ncbi:unnamed protein product [Prunus armeniaca]|uniref:Uncharacterized protein n=1 Tax=Prunus armeniaca TaxID=36596 RepID=A0A6J5XFL8_PRUAR|nr:unnamed protein product [Prunus armeniaca]
MRNTCTASYQSLKTSFDLLLQKIILIVSRLDGPGDLEAPAPAAQPQPSATTTAAAARNLDWAKIVVVYCLSTGVSMALIHTQVQPSKLPLSFFFLALAVLLAFACIMKEKQLSTFQYELEERTMNSNEFLHTASDRPSESFLIIIKTL